MTTTIQISDDTLELLKKYKEQTKAQTYDEVIRNFMKMKDYAKSFRGYLGKKNMKFIMKDLRDKKDRF
ncbi:hypothetical protein J4216_00105 [Candidatus Woesearchaeota archaeon]|nr:hypothetical protein [Candidatus Woesearchaeota archaeon]